jgi:hypothetical protein
MVEPHDYYACNGFCNQPDGQDDRYGLSELVLYNPNGAPADVHMTLYFEDAPPVELDEQITVPPGSNVLRVFPEDLPELLANRGHWGARYRSTQRLIVNAITLDGIHHPDARYQGGVESVMATPLSREWYYADGVQLDWVKHHRGDASKAPFPFNELEYYHFLNPNSEPVSLTIDLQYRSLPHDSIQLTVPAQRVATWNAGQHAANCEAFGVRIDSDAPIATSYVRYVYGLDGIDEWGMHVHFALAGTRAEDLR